MIALSSIQIGDVFRVPFSQEVVRVIHCDGVVVFYDCYSTSNLTWFFGSHLRRSATYFRISAAYFAQHATFISHQELTPEEWRVFRPDLPNCLCRYQHLFWEDRDFGALEEFQDHLLSKGIAIEDKIILPLDELMLTPFGARGRTTSLPTVRVRAENKIGFTQHELLWRAHQIQAPYAKHAIDPGVGLFRSGHQRGVISYYIHTYYDMAGHLKEI